ncbi:unnamed protein product [Triticum turgidum subsp. durum]|uniref:Amino acid permease n=1 Tax=Triticum turgidum subsp. durum TaxID=4567 RepID=A0A9R0RF27_TRITD|nr:unnamed protein product [Triticum turgidum subsp. durum]
MLSVFCYTEFAVEIPVAGGSFAYLRVELGDVAAFIAAANLILESIIGTAAVARSWTSYFASLINKPASALRIQTSLKDGYNELDPIAVVVIAVTATMAILSAKGTSRINWVASAIHVVVIAFVIVAGFIHANPSNLTPFMPHGVPGVFQAAAIVLDVLSSLLSISTLFIFMMMAIALLVRRYYVKGVTTRSHALRLLVFLLVIIASSAGIAAYWGTTPGREDELKDYGDAADDAADEKATAKTADVERASAGDGGR